MSAYRDEIAKFAGRQAQVLGISTDDLATQKKFAESLKLPFPLLADPDGTVARAYGVLDGKTAQRTTFVIDKHGTIVKVVDGLSAISPSPALDACEMPPKGT